MATSIIDGTKIDTSVFSYSAPKAHASGGKVVNLYNKNSRASLTLATPLLMTWGAQESKDQQGNTLGKWTMSLQFPSKEYPNEAGEAFLASIKELERKVKADAITYSKEWFGKSITSSDVMDEKFNVMLRYPKIKGSAELDHDRAPTMTVKLPCWSGVWKSEIYDEEGEPLYVNGKTNSHLNPLEFLTSKSQVICLIQCGGLWFVNGKVSITWNLTQAMVQRPKGNVLGQCLLTPKKEDTDKLKSFVRDTAEDVDPEGAVSATVVADSDDEEDEEEAIKTEAKQEVAVVIQETLQETQQDDVVKKKRIVKKKTVVSEA
uniref:Uncharacterized protein n=1 Tax=viral metagenome TaxID=1070528 RepID=A0A6C0LJ77_9ZZZZ